MKKALKSIYKAIPLKKQIFSAIKSVWTPPISIYKHLHFKGAFQFNIDRNTHLMLYANHSQFENELFWNGFKGSWEQTSLPIWVKLCKDAKVVLDIGAQSGIYSLITQAVNPSCQIHAFEPTDYFFKELQRNSALNNYNINCHNIAISNIDGNNRIENVWQDDKDVKSIKLDTFIEKNNIGVVDLIKIDVDFHEIEVAEGFAMYFKKFQPTVLIEVLHDDIAKGIEKYWKTQELGYLIFSIEEESGVIRQLYDMNKRDLGMNFLLCKSEIAKKIGLI
jgi:FkbM family methyltransferase